MVNSVQFSPPPCGRDPEAFLQSGAQADDSEVAEIEALIQQRLDARKAKDWSAADAARDRLNEMGIVLEDGPQGTDRASGKLSAVFAFTLWKNGPIAQVVMDVRFSPSPCGRGPG